MPIFDKGWWCWCRKGHGPHYHEYAITGEERLRYVTGLQAASLGDLAEGTAVRVP